LKGWTQEESRHVPNPSRLSATTIYHYQNGQNEKQHIGFTGGEVLKWINEYNPPVGKRP